MREVKKAARFQDHPQVGHESIKQAVQERDFTKGINEGADRQTSQKSHPPIIAKSPRSKNRQQQRKNAEIRAELTACCPGEWPWKEKADNRPRQQGGGKLVIR